YSATYFQNELIEYEEADFVLKGDSTEEPLYQLLCAIKNNDSFSLIPNLTWKDETGSHSNPIEYVPNDLGSSTNNYPSIFRSAIKYLHFNHMTPLLDWWQYPIVAIMSCRGCAFNCAICGGSCFAAQSVYGRRAPSFRPPQMLVQDIEAVSRYTKGPIFIIGDLRQAGDEYAKSVLHELKGKNISNQVVLELFDTAPQWFFEEIGQSLPNFNFEISPESCNERIRQVSGKWYTNQELEGNLRWAFEAGCKKFDIFFIIGLPEQTQEAVMADVDYCRYLLSTFGNSVSPFISPLAPFLDPGSIAFENANDMGYTIFYHSLEDYRNALLQPSWKYTLSYETKWMTREEIVMVTYKSARELNHIKWQCGLIDQETHSTIERRIDAALELLEKIDRMMDIVDYTERKKRLHNLKSCMDAARVSIICEKDEIKWPLLKGIGGFKVRNILKDLIFKQLWSSW
ncbi:MAG: radical SAM protein, partial [Thermodesulfobacteriota bacterium]|nr:radical SAM protein [Thermodesulfobacteriota bacterium]